MKPHLTKTLKHKSLISCLLILSGIVGVGAATSITLITKSKKDKIKSVNNLLAEFALSEKSPEINKVFYHNSLLKTKNILESKSNSILPKDTNYIISLVELILPFNSNEVKNYIKDSVTLINENLKGKFAIDIDKNSYFLWINFSEITKFENDFNMNFLQKASFIDDVGVRLNKNGKLIENYTNFEEREKLYNNLEIESNYNPNFASNRFDESGRYENIKMFSNNPNQNRVKVGVLEVGEGERQKEALIDVYDKNYFKINTKIPRAYNRWDFFLIVVY